MKSIEQIVDDIHSIVNSIQALEYEKFGLSPLDWEYDISNEFTYFDQTVRKKIGINYCRLYVINEGNDRIQTIAINKRFLIKYAGHNESDIASGAINLEGALVLIYPLGE